MSFIEKIKNELYKIECTQSCCKKAQLYAILLFGDFFYKGELSLKNKDEKLLSIFENLISDNFSDYFVKQGVVFKAKGNFEERKIFSEFGYNEKILSLRINKEIIENDCCLKAFLIGVFLMNANAYPAEKGYRIEFKTHYMNLANDLSDIISSRKYQIKSRITRRQGLYVVYIKGAEAEENLLALIGAQKSAMDIMQERMIKETRNHLNRVNNFDVANISRTASAVAKQLSAIYKIEKKIGLENIDPRLKEAAQLRKKNPDKSLSELCKAQERLNKSVLNYRLNKLIDIAKKL